jgi:hypothetical protein
MKRCLSIPEYPFHMRGGSNSNTSAACGKLDPGEILGVIEFEGFYRETERWCCTECKKIYDAFVKRMLVKCQKAKIKNLNRLIWSPADQCYKLTIKPADYAYPYTFHFRTYAEAKVKIEWLREKFGIEAK